MTDFSIMEYVLVIEVDEMKVCTSVQLSVDEIVEGTQSFSINISSASPFVNFDPNNLLDINIQDDDCKSYVRLYFQYNYAIWSYMQRMSITIRLMLLFNCIAKNCCKNTHDTQCKIHVNEIHLASHRMTV